MLIIQEPNDRVGKKITPIKDKRKKYRWLHYLYFKEVDNYILIYNLLTTCLIRLDKEEYNNYLNIDELKDLIFVVPKDYPEYDIYQYFFSYFKTKEDYSLKGGLRSYTIMSTSKCDAHCKYCYENGMKRQHMDDHTLNNLIRLIKDNYNINHEKVEIGMFGGEPMFYQKVWDKLFTSLKEADIPYNSIFISNGYLMNEKLVDKMVNLYHTTSGQIPIDGTEKNYNKIKNFIYKDDPSPFRTVINNAKNLLGKGIRLIFRINFDPKDFSDQEQVGLQLLEEFKDYPQNMWNVYFHELFGEYDYETQNNIIKFLDKHKNHIGYIIKNDYLPTLMATEKCMTDSMYSIMINSNGDLYKCESLPKEGLIGNLNDYYDKGIEIESDKVKEHAYGYLVLEECKTCQFKPECLLFKYCSIPSIDKCPLTEKRQIEMYIDKAIVNNYKRYLEKHK